MLVVIGGSGRSDDEGGEDAGIGDDSGGAG